MSKIITIFNQKGGVGKTTTAINLAAALGFRGKRTLLVDFDPQGNATDGLGFDKSELEKTIYDVIINDADIKSVILNTDFKNLSVIPADINLAGAEIELSERENHNMVLKSKLSPIAVYYDYIIIDCPPSLGLLSINALAAADSIIVPLQCEYYALEGLSQLVNTVRSVKKLYNPELQLDGVLFTMFDSRLKLNNMVIEEVEKYFGGKIFKIKIPRSVKLAEAPSFGKPVIYYDKFNKTSFAYKKLADEVIGKS